MWFSRYLKEAPLLPNGVAGLLMWQKMTYPRRAVLVISYLPSRIFPTFRQPGKLTWRPVRNLILLLLLIGAGQLTGQNYYVMIIKGKVTYEGKELRPKSKITTKGQSRLIALGSQS